MKRTCFWLLAFCVTLFPNHSWSQFNSGSDGSDGAFEITVPGTYDFFDPSTFPQPVDVDGDHVFHFTSVNIGPDVRITLRKNHVLPVTWLVSGSVMIAGTVDLDGESGHVPGDSVVNNSAGAGGYQGGRGGNRSFFPHPGSGPGGGSIPTSALGGGGGAGHLLPGIDGRGTGGKKGRAYGNEFLLPLTGGSGGAGGKSSATNSTTFGSGGGAGGGAILIAASGTIQINGVVTANGGNGGNDGTSITTDGGGGSGGGIRLMATRLEGNGEVRARFGPSNDSGSLGDGANGRIRIESFENQFTGTITPLANFATPGRIFLPSNQVPIRITAIAGVAVPGTPLGSTNPVDLELNVVGETTVSIATTGIPIGTLVNLAMVSEAGIRIDVETTPLVGTPNNATATATVTIPHGFSRFFVDATWAP